MERADYIPGGKVTRKKARLPAHIVIPRKSNSCSLEIKTLTDGIVQVKHSWWLLGGRKGSVTLYYDPGCLSFQIIDPIGRLIKQRRDDAETDAKRLRDWVAP